VVVMQTTFQAEPIKPYKRLYSLEEFFAMSEAGIFKNQQVELIDGEVIILPPQGKGHSQAVRRLNEHLVLLFHTVAFVSTQCPLILDGIGKLYLEPDLALLKLPKEQYDDKYVEPSDTLLLIEISDSTLEDDQTTKLERYARNGIKDYWIVNLPNQKLEVYRNPENGKYNTALEFKAGQAVAPLEFPDVEIRWW
jgi:Uma2 family endonuclease